MSDPPNAALPALAGVPVTETSSLWDRISTWAAQNKTTVYTIAGVTLIVTAGGVIYYSSSAPRANQTSAAEREELRRARKDKKKNKGNKDAASRESTESSTSMCCDSWAFPSDT